MGDVGKSLDTRLAVIEYAVQRIESELKVLRGLFIGLLISGGSGAITYAAYVLAQRANGA